MCAIAHDLEEEDWYSVDMEDLSFDGLRFRHVFKNCFRLFFDCRRNGFVSEICDERCDISRFEVLCIDYELVG